MTIPMHTVPISSPSLPARSRAAALRLACGLPMLFAASALAHDAEACSCEAHKRLAWEMAYGSAAAAPAGFDESTGRNTRNDARDLPLDFLHMRLEVVIDDMNTPVARCEQTLSVTPTSMPVNEATLDARGLAISAVASPELAAQGIALTHEHDGQVLRLRFTPALTPGTTADIITTYEVRSAPRGLLWTPESPMRPGQPAQLHTQGQPEQNSWWFPCHDSPNEKLTTELIVTVPQGFAVSVNGRLVDVKKTMRRRPGVAGRGQRLEAYETFHWLQDKPHANYLVSMVVGKFDIVDVGGISAMGYKPRKGEALLSMPVYVPVGRGSDVARSYGMTSDMVRLFERRFDEPYPWARYAQILAWNFEAGGMENTSATTMHENAVLSASAALDHGRGLESLIAHELGHQWFGDLTTCNTWEHLWLNEGWATFCETLWFEHRDGEAGLTRDVIENYDRVAREDRGTLPDTVGMVSKVWRHPGETFSRGSNPYPKGASILHMLRLRLGDEAFFRGVAAFLDAHKLSTVESFQFRQALEDASGQDLTQFFEQWTTRPNIPRLNVSYRWVPERSRLRVTVEQTQPINEHNPAFEFPLAMFLKNTAGPDVVIQHPVTKRSETFEVELEGPASFVAVNHDLSTLCTVSIVQDESSWLAQLASAPTLAARIAASRALGDAAQLGQDWKTSPASGAGNEALRTIAARSGESEMLRVEAILALAKRDARNDLVNLAGAARDDWECRLAVADALSKTAGTEASQSHWQTCERLLLQRARSDESIKVRAEAVRGLADMRSPAGEELARAMLDEPSHADAVRQGSIAALRSLAPKDAISTLSPYASSSFDSRTRESALRALAELGRDEQRPAMEREIAFKTIQSNLTTPNGRVRRTAGEAMVRLGDARGAAALDEAAETYKDAPLLADQLRAQAQRLRDRR